MKKKKDKTKEFEKQIEELKAGWQRTQADFENYRKRVEAEKLENLGFAKAEFIAKISPVLDNFYRAFKHVDKNDKITRGFLQIQKQLETFLTEEGLKKISAAAGEKFDPQYHEAISYEENHLPKDFIITEVESGWIFQDKVIKPAKVRVSRGKQP